jgi:hypothetical protein
VYGEHRVLFAFRVKEMEMGNFRFPPVSRSNLLTCFRSPPKIKKLTINQFLGKIGMIDESFRRDVVNSVVIEKELVPMKMFSNFPSFDESYKICKP